MKIKKLPDDQVVKFDTDYVKNNRWEIIKKHIESDFSNKPFSFLDLGGGNGIFTDKLLDCFPGANATILDNSDYLLSKNKKYPGRKTIICDSVENMETLFSAVKFDVIFMNWILHHLVTDSYSNTQSNIEFTIRAGSTLLRDNGRMSIFENIYDGWFFDDLPGYLIYHLTSCGLFPNVMRRLGANTAGTGVCFHSMKAWLRLFGKTGMTVIDSSDDAPRDVSLFRKLFLHMGHIRAGHFWLKNKT